MAFTLDLWQVISLIITLITGFFILGKMLMSQQLKQIQQGFAAQDKAFESQNKRLERIEETNRDEANNWQRVEREILILKAELPLNYVRREDYAQTTATIMAKLDAMYMRFENIILKGQQKL